MIKFLSEAYTIQEDTTLERNIITAGELFLEEKYMEKLKSTQSVTWNNHNNRTIALFQYAKFYIHIWM